MSKLKTNQKGFSAVELIMVFVIIALLGAVGYMIYKNHHQTLKVTTVTKAVPSPSKGTSSSALSSNKVISSVDDKLSVTLPSNWKVTYSLDNPSSNQIISNATATKNQCFNASITYPCAYSASFAPSVVCTTTYCSESQWTLQVAKTTNTPAEIIQSEVGDLVPSGLGGQNNNDINGYPAEYVKFSNPSTGLYYAITNNGYAALFVNNQLNDQTSTDTTINNPSSIYISQFQSIVDSIKFNN